MANANIRMGKCSFYPSNFFGCSNNQIDINKINNRKTNLITYVQGPHKIIRPTGSQEKRCICHPELRRRSRGLGIWRGGGWFIGSSEEQMLVNNISCHAETTGHLEDFDLQALPSPLSSLVQLVHNFVVISGGSSLAKAGHITKFFR